MNKKGFTLIEIMVAVSIIGILTVIGVSSFRVANKKGRDGRRKGDLEQIRAALEMYRTDQGSYPDLNIIAADKIEFAGATTVVYMSDIPNDPDSDNSYVYLTPDLGVTYSLGSYLELLTTDNSSLTGCTSISGDCNYQVTSPE